MISNPQNYLTQRPGCMVRTLPSHKNPTTTTTTTTTDDFMLFLGFDTC
jgi:hypothetical protein